jgi:hypothetical protein
LIIRINMGVDSHKFYFIWLKLENTFLHTYFLIIFGFSESIFKYIPTCAFNVLLNIDNKINMGMASHKFYATSFYKTSVSI